MRGTVGGQIVVSGSGLASNGKANVKLLLDGARARGSKLEVTHADGSSVGAFVKKAKAGLHDVEVTPKGGDAMVLEDAYEA